MRRLSRVGFALLALVFAPAVASAQETPAMHAFEEGRTLALKGNCAAAIDKFTQSITAEPSIGAYLNRGACRAQLGDPAHAWADYAHAEELALAKGAPETERLSLARKGAADLQPRLLKVVVQIPSGIDGVDLRIDGERFGVTRFAEGVAVDPATAHRMTASAPNHGLWTKDGVTGAAGSTVTLTVSLAAEPSTAVDQATSPSTSGAPPASPMAPMPQGTATPESPPPPQTQRTIGLIVGGVGVVGVAVGGVFGLVAQSKLNNVKQSCGNVYPNGCAAPSGSEDSDNNSARSAANASTVAFIVGGAALAAGAILFFTAPSASSAAARLRLAPAVAEHTGGLSVSGAW